MKKTLFILAILFSGCATQAPLTYYELDRKAQKAVTQAIVKGQERYKTMKTSPYATQLPLNLHGIEHEEVDRVVENFVLLNSGILTIITGHSFKMCSLVVNVLDRHQIPHDIRLDVGVINLYRRS
ncbi:MAG: hypothetical protein H8E12_15375 [Rhodobacteraceae bacterium]|nr:hypothetical protein [Paracoccaceae bacterium]